MIEKEVTIINKLGLHARAAAKFVSLASSFKAHVEIKKDVRAVNAKSIMGVMMLAASKGTVVTLIADGDDEQLAIEKLEDLIENKFDEVE